MTQGTLGTGQHWKPDGWQLLLYGHKMTRLEPIAGTSVTNLPIADHGNGYRAVKITLIPVRYAVSERVQASWRV